MKSCVCFVGLLWFLVLLGSAAPVSATQGVTVRYPSGEETVEGYLVTPPGPGRFPALVVIHEWWGLKEETREEARRLAAEGYVTLAIDLYRGRVASDRDQAHELSRGLPEDRARRDLLAAFDYLAARPEVLPERL